MNDWRSKTWMKSWERICEAKIITKNDENHFRLEQLTLSSRVSQNLLRICLLFDVCTLTRNRLFIYALVESYILFHSQDFIVELCALLRLRSITSLSLIVLLNLELPNILIHIAFNSIRTYNCNANNLVQTSRIVDFIVLTY